MPLELIFSLQGYIGTPSTRKIVSREILNPQREKFLSMIIPADRRCSSIFDLASEDERQKRAGKNSSWLRECVSRFFEKRLSAPIHFFSDRKKCRMTHGEISTREDFFRSSPNQHHDLNRRGCSEKIFFSRFAGSPLRGNFLRCSRKNSCQNKKNHHRFFTRVMVLELF